MPTPYIDFGTWIRGIFPFRVQKLTIDAGFTCPNRDGRISTGGCSFSDNRTFNPSYCDRTKSVTQQLNDGKAFFARKYPDMRYLAYFQAYTNTDASLDRLKAIYEEALSVDGVVGIVIGTRPDCVSGQLLDYLHDLSRHTFVMVEYGIESATDDTLRRINRGHNFECSRQAIANAHSRGLFTCGHVILGLPGEDAAESLRQAPIISSLPIDVLKIHQLQVIRGTTLAKEYAEHPFHIYSAEEYISLVAGYIRLLRRDLVIERFVSMSPSDMLIAPKWGLKSHELRDMLFREMGES